MSPQKINIISNVIGSLIWLTVLLYQVWANQKLRRRLVELEGHLNNHCQAIHHMNNGCRKLAVNIDVIAKHVGILKEGEDTSQVNVQ